MVRSEFRSVAFNPLRRPARQGRERERVVVYATAGAEEALGVALCPPGGAGDPIVPGLFSFTVARRAQMRKRIGLEA